MSLWSPEAKKAILKALITGVGVRLDGSEAGFRQTVPIITHEYVLPITEKSRDVADSVGASSARPLVRTTDSASSALLILFRDKPVVVDELKELEFNIELWGKAFRLGEESLVGINTLKPIGDEFREDGSRRQAGGEPVANAM
ncbi:hypothetical protein EDD16DRAFT_1525930 [Pisolithus croceorrhizus]|nr:hypothetical protein EDD16DRAFT_1525930 [Pisolithus croceorrhizus]